MSISRRDFLIRSGAGLAALSLAKAKAVSRALEQTGISHVFRDKFLLGTAVSSQTLESGDRRYLDLIAREFNAVTAENAHKWESVHPRDDSWTWTNADRLVAFGTENRMFVLGHVLVWHSQVPDSVFFHADGRRLTRAELLQKMRVHIETVVGRYRGRVHAWDVVNEAIDEDKGWRRSHWYDIIGEDFMEQAFRMAHAADPGAGLLYNDYNMHDPAKRAFLLEVLRGYKKRGVPIHGIGLQGHIGLDYPSLAEFENSIEAYAELGLGVHITELDVDVLPAAYDYIGAEISTEFAYSEALNPYVNGLPKAVEEQLTRRYEEVFRLFLKHRDKIERVTFWGTTDAESWKNDFPVKGRTNYPLLFDRNFNRKPAYHAIARLTGG